MWWANSAGRHGISAERSGYIVENYPPADTVALENNPAVDGLLFVGDDQRGVPLEVIAVPVGDGGEDEGLLIIHAMPLRRVYRDLYEQMARERWG